MKNKHLQFGAWALAGAVLCGALVYYNAFDRETTGAMLNEACPDFTVDTYAVENGKFVLSGQSLSLSELSGKVVVLNFWATWCQPCKEEIPHFNELYEKYRENVEVVILNGDTFTTKQGLLDDYMNNQQNAEEYQKYYGNWTEFTCTFARFEADNNVKELFEVGDGLPVTVIVNREGVIKTISEASMTLEQLENAVLPLLE